MKLYFLAASAAIVSFAAASALAEDLDFLLVNESPSPVTQLYVSPASSGSYEDNLLQGGILNADYEVDVLIAGSQSTCVYNIHAVFDDGERLEDYGLDLCELGSYTFE